MATDPLRRVRRTTRDIQLTFGIRDALRRLAGLPHSIEVPYVTVSLDWTPAGGDPGRDPVPVVRRSQWRAMRGTVGQQRRPSRLVMEQELDRLIAEHGPRGTVHDSLTAVAERIESYIDNELDPAAQGVYIVANTEQQVFEALALGLPVETSIHIGPTPVVTPLAKKIDDHPAYLVLVADQHEATLAVIRRARHGRGVWLESSDYPRRTQQGGESQRRYQARHDERVGAFVRAIADETLRAIQEEDIDMLIVAGDDVITSALNAEFHHIVQDRIVDTIRLDIRASEQEILEATLPIIASAEREQEQAKVLRIAGEVGAGGRGAAGSIDVLRALQGGQVATLAMVDDYAEQGWADFERDFYGVGPVPDEHPLGGNVSDLVPIALEEELVRLAVQTSASVEFVATSVSPEDLDDVGAPESNGGLPRTEAARQLDELGGVGAILRYN